MCQALCRVSSLHIITLFSPRSRSLQRFSYLCFAGGKMEAQTDEVTCPRSHSRDDRRSSQGPAETIEHLSLRLLDCKVFVSKSQMAKKLPLSTSIFHTKCYTLCLMSTAIFKKMNLSLWVGKTLQFCKDRKNCLNPKISLMKSFVARIFLVILFLISNEINNMKTGKCY